MIIYKITNLINKKVYIGQTICSMHKRFREHCYKYDCSKKISRAIQKYGKENFIIEKIDSANSIEELNQKESLWIEIYDSMNDLKGYNLKSGGKNCYLSQETKNKIRDSHKGKKHTQETKEKLRLIKAGQIPNVEKVVAANLLSGGHKRRFSKYKNVRYDKKRDKWSVEITINKKKKFVGYFPTEECAAKASDIFCLKTHGEKCFLNFPNLKEFHKNVDLSYYKNITV